MGKRFLIILLFLFVTWNGNSSATIVVPPISTSTEPDPARIKAALEEFRTLPKKEKKIKLKQARKEIKAFKKARKRDLDPDTNTLLLVILAILLPPLAVYLHEGEANNKFWIALLLTLLAILGAFFLSWVAWFAAVVYALIVVLS